MEVAAPTRFSRTTASVLLDLTRGIAAFLVLTSHWRDLFFVDFPETYRRSHLLGRLLAVPYLLFGAGHEAVVIFFVLSGYLISGSIFRLLQRGQWNWGTYLTHRIVRLWIVLLPGLLVCALWDRLGLGIHAARPLYLGLGGNGIVADVTGKLSARVFFGNLFFLHPMLVPTYGSDSALWSLPNEFWYYILFPLGLVAARRQFRWSTRSLCLVCFVLSAWFVRGGILWMAPIWLMGSVLALAPAPRFGPAVRWTALALYLPAVFCSKAVVLPGHTGDYLLGICTALFLWAMLSATREEQERSRLSRTARGLSRFSYTLYVVHLPVLVFAAALLVGPVRWSVDARHVAVAEAVLLAAAIYALGIAALTEFHTDRVRRWVELRLGLGAEPGPQTELGDARPSTGATAQGRTIGLPGCANTLLSKNLGTVPNMSSKNFQMRTSRVSNMRSIFSLFSSDLAIDLGTANTLVYAHGKGIIVNEPSIIAVNRVTGEVEAVGKEAKEMLGRTPGNIIAIKPMKDGVIADFKQTEKMLNYFIQKAHNRKMMVHPRIVIGVPSEITQVEKRAVMDSAYRAKASEVHLVEQAMVAAIGAGLPITEPGGNMVVDIGGGTTDIAVISLAGIVYSRSVRMAGNQMDEAVATYLKRKYNLLVGERTAEQIKIEIGSAFPLDKPLTMEIKGRNLIEGVPKTIPIEDSEVREALSECISTIINAIRVALERTPPELSADISDRGIVLTGGGALIKNLDKRIREETGLPVSIADDPLASVVLGTGKMLSDFRLLRKISID